MPRLRIAIVGQSPCDGCGAHCCRQIGHEYAVLLEGDERRKFAPYAIEVTIGEGPSARLERVLPYIDGRCRFLDADNRCLIYEDRPQNCRRFQCISGYHLGGSDIRAHSLFLQRNHDVLRRLEEL